jgi:hypothetical protein
MLDSRVTFGKLVKTAEYNISEVDPVDVLKGGTRPEKVMLTSARQQRLRLDLIGV